MLQDYKINTPNSIVFLHISKINLIMNFKIIPLKTVPKGNKILGIYLVKVE